MTGTCSRRDALKAFLLLGAVSVAELPEARADAADHLSPTEPPPQLSVITKMPRRWTPSSSRPTSRSNFAVTVCSCRAHRVSPGAPAIFSRANWSALMAGARSG